MSGTTVMLVLLLVALWRRGFAGYPPMRRPEFTQLNRREVAVVESIGEAMFPAGGAVPQSAADADVPGYVDRYMSWHSPSTRFLMHALFLLMEHGTLLFVPSWRRLTSLDPEARERYLAGWENSRFYPRRMVFQSLRALMCLAYLGSPDVERAIGMTRPERCREAAARLWPGDGAAA